MMDQFTFYMGTHQLNWLWDKPNKHPLFISIRTIRRYKSLRQANIEWCCDSGGFTELTMFDKWVTTPEEYCDDLYKAQEMGKLVWAAPQDWMCEPHMLVKTGKTVNEHQHLSCQNFCELKQLAPDLPIIPALQGWKPEEYVKHLEMYSSYGIDLRDYQTVGLGSFCRRAKVAGVRELVIGLNQHGLKLHGFGLKKDGLKLFRNHLLSSDSLAWSMAGRFAGRNNKYLCGKDSHRAKNCANCFEWSQIWADDVAATQQNAHPMLWE